MAVEHPQHLALGIGAAARGEVVDLREHTSRRPIVRGAFHRDDPLPRRRQHLRDRKLVSDAVCKAHPLKARAGHDQRVRRADRAATGEPLLFQMVELAHAGVGSAAIVNHFDIGEEPARIGGAAHRIGANLEALAARGSQFLDRQPWPQHQHVVCRIARKRRADHQPRRILVARHVLERMHRRLQLPGANGIDGFQRRRRRPCRRGAKACRSGRYRPWSRT